MTFRVFDVVVVPFPFTDSKKQKKRPALVLSSASAFNSRIGHSILAMITSAKNSSWPLDTPIGHLKQAGLAAPSVIRMKVFTLDHRFILKKIGSLAPEDRAILLPQIKKALALE